MEKIPLSKALIKHREEKGLSIEELAALCEPPLSTKVIKEIESGKSENKKDLPRIAAALGIPPIELTQHTSLATKIKTLRIKQGFTQRGLGEACRPKVSQNAIYKLENGQTLGSRNLPSIAKALGVSIEYLLDPDIIRAQDTIKTSVSHRKILNFIQDYPDNSEEVQTILRFIKSVNARKKFEESMKKQAPELPKPTSKK